MGIVVDGAFCDGGKDGCSRNTGRPRNYQLAYNVNAFLPRQVYHKPCEAYY